VVLGIIRLLLRFFVTSTMQVLRNSLDAFDQQLEILEQLLEPRESVSGTWARTTSASDAAGPGNRGA
jgi:hypothetical protein